jgi:hypothetical protein
VTVAPIQSLVLGQALSRVDALVLAAPLVAVEAKLAALTAAPVTPVVSAAEPASPDEAVRAAAQSAAIRQAGLAPLMADLEQAVAAPDMPAPVQAAIRQVLAFRLDADRPPTAADMKQALSRSGLFLEARLAAADTVATGPASMAATDLKAALLVFRQVLSAWAGPQPAAPVSAAPADPSAAARPVVAAGAQAQPQASPTAPVHGATTAALRPEPQSGATAGPASAPPTTASPQASTTTLATDPRAPGTAPAAPLPDPETVEVAGPPATPAAPGQSAPTRSPAAEQPADRSPAPPAAPSLPAQQAVDAPLARPPAAPPAAQAPISTPLPSALAEETPPQAAAPPSAPDRAPLQPQASFADAAGPPPPYRNGPTRAQPPAEPSLPARSEPAVVAQRLLQETDGALARQELHQIASLPQGPELNAGGRADGARWMFEAPFATPQGAAVAQFEISRDGGGGGAYVGDGPPVWSARFSFDMEPGGPVHARVTLSGARAGVTLWAEREATLARLRTHEESLGAALRRAAFEPEILVRSGAPSRPAVEAPAPGRFVDRAT